MPAAPDKPDKNLAEIIILARPKPERFNWIDNLEVISLSKSTHKK
jgi:hypothetical protein